MARVVRDEDRQIVRRESRQMVQADEPLPERIHHGGGIVVSSQLTLGVEPRMRVSWAVAPQYWARGFTLLVFRNTSGFCPERYPEDLNRHGELVVETYRDDGLEQCLAEGAHYFTFVLYKKILLGLSERMSVVRFSETVPSAKLAIGRIRDQIDLQEMFQQHELGKIEHEAKLNEAELRLIRSRQRLRDAQDGPLTHKKPTATEALIAEELADIDALVEAMFAKRTKLGELKNDARFRNLSRQEKQAVIERINERLDAAEFSARREMRGQ